jgi:hypothetical protein
MKCGNTQCKAEATNWWYIPRMEPLKPQQSMVCEKHRYIGFEYFETEEEALRAQLEALL